MNTTKSKVQITKNQLVDLLNGVTTPQFISLFMLTDVVMNKFLNYKENGRQFPNPYFNGGVKKLSKKYKIIIGFDYENSVNGRLEKEGKESDFESQKNWFEHISKCVVTDTKTGTKKYLTYQYLKDSTLTEEFHFDNDIIGKEMFKQYMKSSTDYSNQGLDNPLMYQVVNIDNIVEISMGGSVYELI